MNLYFRRQLPHSGSYLDEFQTNRIELSMRPLASLQMESPERMQKDISHRVEKQAKLVGFEAAAFFGEDIEGEVYLKASV